MARVFPRFTPGPGSNKKDRGPKEVKQPATKADKPDKPKNTTKGSGE